MDSSRTSDLQQQPADAVSSAAPEARLRAISSMLQGVDEAAPATQGPKKTDYENKLVQVRLGVASGLFAALQAKHPASAAHSLRVALGCSAWGLAMDVTDQQRDEIEAAALLHDVGKLGVPDHVLLKPAALDADELALMQRHRDHGVRILSACCSSDQLLDIVRYAPTWFGPTNQSDDSPLGDDLPLGARMLAIVDAFDSMTTDHVWRRGMSRERAMAELFNNAGSQFDPELVKQYCELQAGDQAKLQARVARRWLQQLDASGSNALWRRSDKLLLPAGQSPAATSPFHQMLVDNMTDAVIFVDKHMQITLWNHGAQRLTGISPEGVVGKLWLPRLIEMLNDRGLVVADEDCPIAEVMRSGEQIVRRVSITGRNGKELQINAHIMPVLSQHSAAAGAVLLLHDISSETTLEEQIQSLSERATKDALTKVANRAEFDRSLVKLIETHLTRGVPCSLILCDIDHFKKINDTYGHQAGDEALITFANLLKRSCRPGDVVARYGGEEFALLCADCDNASATARAENVRKGIAAISHDVLGGTSFTCSFGVTELQQGDSPETMLRRADRGLYEAKEMGRNIVVQLGAGLSGRQEELPPTWWQSWFGGGKVHQLIDARLITSVPMKMVVEKLRGFVADQEAEISSIDENHVVLTIDGPAIPLLRRSQDRVVPFTVELDFDEKTDAGGQWVRTMINVVIRPKRGRDRRKQDSVERARQVLSSLKSYLMAHDYLEDEAQPGKVAAAEERQKSVLRKAKALLKPWLETGEAV